MIKTEKFLRLKNYRGEWLRVVREHYLREKVPCCSSLCQADCEQDVKVLPDDLTHYVMPDAGVVLDYLEILEFRELQGIVFTQTACQALLHKKKRRQYNRLKNLLKDPRHDCVLFANEFQRYAYCPRDEGESQEKWQTRCVYSAAVWYYNHLAGMMDIVMITEDRDALAKYSSRNPGVYVISVQEYLKDFWSELQAAQELYSNISQSLQEKESDGSQREFEEHLPEEVLEAGIKSGRYIMGTLNVGRNNGASILTKDFLNEDKDLSEGVLVLGSADRNRAIHRDVVVAEVFPRSQWRGKNTALTEGQGQGQGEERSADENISKPRPTGRVVGILQRNWRDYVVTFPPREGTQTQRRILTVPWDPRIPKIRISTQQADALQDHRVVVRIDSWEATSKYPNGHTVRVLGQPGEFETEVQTILIENSIQVSDFSDAQLREMPANSPERPWRMDPAQVAQRRDLRDRLVFSIDPPGCEDVDDAMSVRGLADDGKLLELGVHIADVTHFVPEGSLTDLEARIRGTTYYLADRRYDMLPAVLSADLCSLLRGVDRYAMSVMWKLDADTLEVKDVWYGRTVIRSSYQLHYGLAQALVNGEQADVPELAQLGSEEKSAKLAQLKQALEKLTNIARRLRAKRDRGGALELEGEEVRAQLDEERNITALVPKQPLEVNETVAECMIYANHWVARKIQETFPHQALLRRHPLPSQEAFGELVDIATAAGFTMDTSTNKALADSLDRAVDPKDPLVNRLLRMRATKAMPQALYFSTDLLPKAEYYHYGLALDYYTHFTSPIRRYADVVVHRLLTAAIAIERAGDAGKASNLLGSKEQSTMAQHINERNRAAKAAQRMSVELCQCLFFKERDPQTDPRCVADAVIFNIRHNGVLVYVPEYGVKDAVFVKNREGQVLFASEGGSCEWQSGSVKRYPDRLTTTTGGGTSTFRLFDHITVCISVQSTQFHKDTIRLEMVSNRPHCHSTAEPQQEQRSQARCRLVEEAVRLAEEASQQQKAARRHKFTKEESQFCQSKTPNLYSLLEEVRELALMDLDSAQKFCATKTLESVL